MRISWPSDPEHGTEYFSVDLSREGNVWIISGMNDPAFIMERNEVEFLIQGLKTWLKMEDERSAKYTRCHVHRDAP